jgi:hypothetical protein
MIEGGGLIRKLPAGHCYILPRKNVGFDVNLPMVSQILLLASRPGLAIATLPYSPATALS